MAALGIISPSSTTLEDLTTTSNTTLDAIAVDVAASAVRGDVSGTIYDPVSGTNLTIKRAFASLLTAADTNIITGVTGKKLRVLAIKGYNNATASNITFKQKPSGSAVAISAAYVIPVAGVLDFHPNNMGWFETPADSGFIATAAAGGTVAVQVIYVEVPA